MADEREKKYVFLFIVQLACSYWSIHGSIRFEMDDYYRRTWLYFLHCCKYQTIARSHVY